MEVLIETIEGSELLTTIVGGVTVTAVGGVFYLLYRAAPRFVRFVRGLATVRVRRDEWGRILVSTPYRDRIARESIEAEIVQRLLAAKNNGE